MAFPTDKDVLTNPVAGDKTTSPSHISQHRDANDAIGNVQDTIGITGSTDTASLEYRVANASSISPGHKHALSDNTDVDTTGVADGNFLVYVDANNQFEPSTSSTANASTTVLGKVKVSTTPAGDPTAVETGDPRVPTADEIASINGADTPDANNLMLVESNLTGAVLPFAGSTAPTGWLLSYGQAVSRTTYSALFAVVSTTYGVGDGSTTFNLPDLRGNMPLGKDNMGGSSRNRVTHANADTLGGEEGDETHTLTEAEMPAHTHGAGQPFVTTGTGAFNVAGGSNASSQADTASTGSDTAHENMSPYMTLNYIIKT